MRQSTPSAARTAAQSQTAILSLTAFLPCQSPSRNKRSKNARLAAIPPTEERVIVATGRYLGEGFDDSRLDTLFLTMPIAWKGTLAQYAGRLHRLHDAKRKVIIYDYVDMSVPVLARMAAKRRVGYQTIGYRILGTGDLFSDQSVASGEAPATFSV
jgi:superfamily II DNA or RNA helicase